MKAELISCFQVSKIQYDKIFRYIGYGKEDGAKLALGGEKRQSKGYFVDPTSMSRSTWMLYDNVHDLELVFTDVKPGMRIVSADVMKSNLTLTHVVHSVPRRDIRTSFSSH